MEERPEPIVIRVPGSARSSDGQDAQADTPSRGSDVAGLVLTLLGAFLLDLAALLPWWQLDSKTGIPVPAEFLVTIPGRTSWQGAVCLLAGSVILVVTALWNLHRLPRKAAPTATRAVIALACLGVGAGTWGALIVPEATGFDLETTLWPWVAAFGGVLAIVGGAQLLRQATRPGGPPTKEAPTPPTAPSGAFLINPMEEPTDPSAD